VPLYFAKRSADSCLRRVTGLINNRSHIHGKSEMSCWERKEEISWTDHARNAEKLQKVEEWQ
jgi:hypothetical protein